jgi:hypothetical protein
MPGVTSAGIATLLPVLLKPLSGKILHKERGARQDLRTGISLSIVLRKLPIIFLYKSPWQGVYRVVHAWLNH